MPLSPIIGRFAPTPSGPLHFGSLVTALASYCHAKSQQGQWLIRIEDVDTPRVVEGSVDQILADLEFFGFEWDGEILYQSHQFDRYQAGLEQLLDKGLAYACECSRRTLREANVRSGPLGMIYPGTCRNKQLGQAGHSVRINTETSGILGYRDQLYGEVAIDIAQKSGDFVVRRADAIFAYHLAVVLDDELQHMNQIVRGADLLEATCLHLFLYRLFGFTAPEYLHVPLVRNNKGDKLSKQTGATALDKNKASALLISALQVLGQATEAGMQQANTAEIVRQAVESWDYHRIPVPEGDIY
ncbi:MAG: tRNA glutamyl-Q(34) synthetase GluQRS [Gammaproteobacteria bacterium]